MSPTMHYDHGCDGFRALSRRSAIQAGVFGALGFSLGDMLRLQASDKGAFTQESGQKKAAKALSVIQLHLGGG
ncbi:MAG: hypothetical protein ACK6DC_11705, partial [Planctomycetota bacterium]